MLYTLKFNLISTNYNQLSSLIGKRILMVTNSLTLSKQRYFCVFKYIFCTFLTLFISFNLSANSIDEVFQVGKDKASAAQKSQIKIDGIADKTDGLLQNYKQVNKEVEGLRVYNAQLEARIQNQIKRIAEIEEAMTQVTVIQRQITPLMIKMLNGLENFVSLDVPFLADERQNRLDMLRSNLDKSNQTVAENFRQVLEAYKIENEYGRKIEAYDASIDFNGDGQERKVDIFRVGRIALLYKTEDGKEVGRWNNETRSWEELKSGSWSTNINTGIRIARNQAVKDILQLPISAPEVAQ
jgi:hypothetical protein